MPEGKIASLPLVGHSLESDAAALNRLTALLYEQLRRVARRHMVGQRPGHTFSTPDLRLSLTDANLTSERPGEEV